MDVNKIIAGVLDWAGAGCTCEIERLNKCWEIRVSKDGRDSTVHLPDAIYGACKDGVEKMLQAHGRYSIYMLGQK